MIKESLMTKGLKFKDSNVVFGAMIVYILTELTFKLQYIELCSVSLLPFTATDELFKKAI